MKKSIWMSIIFTLSCGVAGADSLKPILSCSLTETQKIVVFLAGVDTETLKNVMHVGRYDVSNPQQVERLDYIEACTGNGSRRIDSRPNPPVLERAGLKVDCGADNFKAVYKFRVASGCTGGAAGHQRCSSPRVNDFTGSLRGEAFANISCHWMER